MDEKTIRLSQEDYDFLQNCLSLYRNTEICRRGSDRVDKIENLQRKIALQTTENES